MDVNKILFRSSQSGKLMTEPKSKSELISETTKEYLEEVFINEYYKRFKPELDNKYVNKGNDVESQSIDLYGIHKDSFFVKNEQHFKNEYLKGTPDILVPLIDIKSSWDIFTFRKAKRSKLDKGYYWQLQSYMDLTGASSATLVYVLENTPDKMIMDAKYFLARRMGILDDETPQYIKLCQEIERNSIFDIGSFIKQYPYFEFHSDIDNWKWDIPLTERIHEIQVERNNEDIELLKARIEDCRLWMQEFCIKPLSKTNILTENLI